MCALSYLLSGGGAQRKHQKFYAYPYKKVKAGAGILLSMLRLKFLQSHLPTGKMADTFLSMLCCKSLTMCSERKYGRYECYRACSAQ